MFSFDQLDLSGVQASSGGGLDLGRQLVMITEPKMVPTASGGGTKLEVKLTNPTTKKSMKHWINVHLPNSTEATRIGREQLKTMLVCAHHPNPDRPGDVATLNGLLVGVNVRQNGDYKEVHYFFDRDEQAGTATPAAGQSQRHGAPIDGIKGDIPF